VLDLLARVVQQTLNRQLGGNRAPRVAGAFEISLQYTSLFSVQLRGRPGEDPMTLLAILSKALEDLALEPAEVAAANERWVTREAAARDASMDRALRLAHHVPAGEADWFADPLHALVTSTELQAALRALLARPRLEVLAHHDPRFPPAGVLVSPTVFAGLK
jgi:hypothetical protein